MNMVEQYLPIAIIFLLALLIAGIAIGLGYIFGPKRPNKVKDQIYESGMVPFGPGRLRMTVRYYRIALLFIIFDIEVVFVVVWALVLRQIGAPGLWAMLIFLAVLELAHIYAWKKGALEWD